MDAKLVIKNVIKVLAK